MYQKTEDPNVIRRIADGAFVPLNGEWSAARQEYLDWVDEGNKAADRDLDKIVAEALAEIDEAAGSARLKYITDVPGQDATYLMKAAEARAFAEAGYSAEQLVDFPMLQAEAEATGLKAQAAADLVIATQDQWIVLAAAIEKVRRSGKISVEAASTASEVNTVRSWALDALRAI